MLGASEAPEEPSNDLKFQSRTSRRLSSSSTDPSQAAAASPYGADGRRQTVPGRVTIRDVAQQAGVSLGTASNVLNRPDRVAADTLARVIEVIDQLGFVRSSAAHQMRGGNSRCFGAVVLDASSASSTETIRGLEDAVHEQGCAVVVCSTDGSQEREARYLRLLEEQRVQGIVITPATRNVTHLHTLRDRGIVVVLLDRNGSNGELCSVSVDHAGGGELTARHLFDLGHTRIAFINGPLHLAQCQARRRGMRRAARLAGLDIEETIIEYTIDPLTAFNQVEQIVDSFLELEDRPTAVGCVNDQIALTVLRDVEFAAMLSPSLTSIRLPKYELGRAAAELLIAETSDPDHRHSDIRFDAELVERHSTSARSRLNSYSPRGV